MNLSLVIPVYNEREILPELVRRCTEAVAHLDGPCEVLLIDDHSTDGSDTWLATVEAPIHHIRLPENRGQWGATRHGLSLARGSLVAVMDGDLQDPPEHLPRLVRQLAHHPAASVAFAVRTGQVDPLWMRVGRRGYRALQHVLNDGNVVPSGAGSYCVMQAEVARQAAAVDLSDANLAAVLTALRVPVTTIHVERAPRAHGTSRVGLRGLTREAIGSLWLLATLGRRSSAGG